MIFNGSKVAEIRKNKLLSVNFIASKLNVSRRTIWLWENNRITPKEKSVRELARVLNVPVSAFSDIKDKVDTSDISLKQFSLNKTDNISSSNKKIENIYTRLIEELIELKKNEQQNSIIINALLNSVNFFFYIKDLNLNYIMDNHPTNIEDGTKELIKNENDFDDYSKKEATYNNQEDEKVIITGKPIINKEGFIPGTKKRKWGLMSKYPIFDSKEKIAGLLGIHIDITERKKNEEKRELFESYINTVKDGVSVININSKCLEYVNKAKTEIYEMSINELINTDIYSIIDKKIHPEDINEVKNAIDLDPIDNLSQLSTEFRIIKSDGSIRWIQQKSYHRYDKTYNCLICIESDITLIKQEEIFRNIFEINVDYIPEAVFIQKSGDSKIHYINEAAEELYGYSVDKLLSGGMDFWLQNCLCQEYAKEVKELLDRKYLKPIICKIRRSNNEIRTIEIMPVISRIIRNEEFLTCIQKDITKYLKISENFKS